MLSGAPHEVEPEQPTVIGRTRVRLPPQCEPGHAAWPGSHCGACYIAIAAEGNGVRYVGSSTPY